MKNTFLAALLMLLCSAFGAEAAVRVGKFGVDTEVCDPVLIYTGGLAKRANWNATNLMPYVTHLYADGHRDWFYDAFIVHETSWRSRHTATGAIETRVLINAGGGQLPATLQDWNDYFDHIFGKGHDLDALDTMIGQLKETLGEPRLRHKVILGIPFPCKDGRGTPTNCVWKKFNFGIIEGIDIDFSLNNHRILASKYAIDELIRRFEAANFENIDLAGFYCAEETLYTVQDFITQVNIHIHDRGYRSYWIPYWTNNDQWALEWKKFGFDIAYRQPNYFFYNSTGLPDISQMNSCITSSKLYGLGLELEFETSGTSNGLYEVAPHMHQRLIQYLDSFEESNVWANSGVAHYTGSKGLVDMANSRSPENLATIDRLADLVIARQKAFAESSGIEAVDAPEYKSPFAYPGTGRIFISHAPDAAVYSLSGTLLHSGDGTFECPAGLYIVTDGHGRSVKVAVR